MKKYWLFSLLLFHLTCREVPNSNRPQDQPFYVKDIHDDTVIFEADSLSWNFLDDKGLQLFKSITHKVTPIQRRYIDSRILTIQSDWNIIDTTLYYKLNSIPNHDRDAYTWTALLHSSYKELKFDTSYKDLTQFHQLNLQTAFHNNNKLFDDDVLSDSLLKLDEQILLKFNKKTVLNKKIQQTELSNSISKRDPESHKLAKELFLKDPGFALTDKWKAKILVKLIDASIVTADDTVEVKSYFEELNPLMSAFDKYDPLSQYKLELDLILQFRLGKDFNTLSALASKHHSTLQTCTDFRYNVDYWLARKANDDEKSETYFISSLAFFYKFPFLKRELNIGHINLKYSEFLQKNGRFVEALNRLNTLHQSSNQAIDFNLLISIYSNRNNYFDLNNYLDILIAKYKYFKIHENIEDCKLIADAILKLVSNSLAAKKESISSTINKQAETLMPNCIFVYGELAKKDKQFLKKYIELILQNKSNQLDRDLNSKVTNHPIYLEDKKWHKEKKMLELAGDTKSEKYFETLKSYNQASANRTKWEKSRGVTSFHRTISMPSPVANTTQLITHKTDSGYDMVMINPDQTYIYTIETTDKISQSLDQLSRILKNSEKCSVPSYDSLSSTIGAWVFPPKYTNQLQKSIIINPDGIFNVLSINALQLSLVGDAKTYKDLNYMGYEYNISHTYSMNTTEQKRDKELKVAIFTYSDNYSMYEKNKSTYRRELGELRGSIEEGVILKKQFPNATIYQGKNATKSNFLKVLQDPDIDIIHLALHGSSNDISAENVKLYFRTENYGKDSIYGIELLEYTTHAQLITLSACESASGFQQNGEGTYSLPRYFIGAGATYVAGTYWNASDKHLPAIVNYFYQNLTIKEGKLLQCNNIYPKKELTHPKDLWPLVVIKK